MPPFQWQNEPTATIIEFESRHGSPQAGALLLTAVGAVDSLYYLRDLDQGDDLSQPTINGHSPDIVDLAHARWATATCSTALDLCAAALGKVFCGHSGAHELKVPSFNSPANRSKLPIAAGDWVDNLLQDTRYDQLKAIRNPLTHSKLPRRFYMPRERIRLQVGALFIDVPTIVNNSVQLATDHVCGLLGILPLL
jgi:hypothetical protein